MKWWGRGKAASALPTRTGGETSDCREPSLNSLLTLAKDLEQKSKAQQQSTCLTRAVTLTRRAG
ncbi:MbeB family mobilization protein, partial [Enterobacter intestinihominis]